MKKLLATLSITLLVAAVPALAAVDCGAGGKECIQLKPAIQNVTSIPGLIGIVIRGALGLIGALTLFMFIWGGIQWVLAAGNAEKIQKGTHTMVWAAIGVVVVFSSYFLISELTKLL